ncbi:4-hydroxy-3-methylbut-2-enyl diphosphate reductase [Prauserella marina]|uniref:4-hydroxy-3-methylbut-2-enyl diphosphate reductase n=1 Tax=Prauserella marina TaxID=530584 RepID=A0A1G6VWD6_9PSEU|nr:4-hydroxy-3-methylbut-2-enyl diphosphate reductase [Prauserella marina]SDD57952.1 4-hydroxy-3-methylbut-2-enyl diphosphate reductase [Prauserella marina]
MSVTAAQSIIAANRPGRPRADVVLVADELLTTGGPPTPCPAAVLLAGELRRQGVPLARGRLRLDSAARETHDGLTLCAVLPGGGGPAGLGVAAADDEGNLGSHMVTAAASAMASCLAAARPRTVLLAAPRSFCAGVERAIEVVEKVLAQRGAPVYVRKQIVHNRHVVADLESRGAVFVDELDGVPDRATVVFSAHGVSPAVHEEAAERGLDVIDATCPLVTKVHAEARRFAARGDTVVLIGHEGHEEVEGTLGEAPENTVLVQNTEEARALTVRDPSRVSYLTQTTLAVDETAEVVEALRQRFPALRGPGSDDICYATTNRQHAHRDRGGRRPGARRRLGELVELGPARRTGPPQRNTGAPHRRRR